MAAAFSKCGCCGSPETFGLYVTEGEGHRISISTEGYASPAEAFDAAIKVLRKHRRALARPA